MARTSNGSRWRRVVRAVIDRDRGICHICGHGGAEFADHVVSVAEQPELEWDVSNVRAAHGAGKGKLNYCPVCSAAAIARGGRPVACNSAKGMGSMERARRILRERTGLPMPGDSDPPGKVPPACDWW